MSQVEQILRRDDGYYSQIVGDIFQRDGFESTCESLTESEESDSQEGRADNSLNPTRRWSNLTLANARTRSQNSPEKWINILQPSSVSRLSVTNLDFEQLLGELGTVSRLQTYLTAFGPAFELKMAPPMASLEPLRSTVNSRSVVGFESTFVLRYVVNNGRGDENPFSIRQTLLHHRYTSSPCVSTHVCVKLSCAAKSTVQSLTQHGRTSSNLHPCTVDLVLVYQAVGTWTAYLRYIANEILKHTRTAEATRFSEEFIPRQRLEQRQVLNQLQEHLLDVELLLTSTVSVLDLFISRFNNIDGELASIVNTTATHEPTHLDIAQRAKDLANGSLAQTRVLAAKAHNATTLTENLLDLENGTELRNLAAISQKENEVLVELSQKAASDGTTVKILTISTLVYLPATVVLNFFSTVLIKQIDSEGGRYKLRLATNWWVFLIVSIPLTFITISLWRCFVNWERNGYPRWITIPLQGLRRLFTTFKDNHSASSNGVYLKQGEA